MNKFFDHVIGFFGYLLGTLFLAFLCMLFVAGIAGLFKIISGG